MLRSVHTFIFILFISSLSFSQDFNWKIKFDSSKYFFKKGEYAISASMLENLIPAVEKNIPDTAAYYEMKNLLGISYLKTSKIPEAENQFKQTIAFYSNHQTIKNHPHYFIALTQLAAVYFSTKKYTDAEPLFRNALHIQKETKGEKNQDYLTLLNNLATIENLLKRYQASDSIYNTILSIKKEMYGEKHPEYFTSLNTIAAGYKNAGRYKQAEETYLKLANALKDTVGVNHPEYGNAINNLGLLYKLSGKYAQADTLLTAVVNIKKQHAAEKPLDYALALNNLALLYKTMNRYAEAQPLFNQTLQIYRSTADTNNIAFGQALSNLASLYRIEGYYSKSEYLFNETRELYKKLVGENHHEYALLLNNIALLYDEMGRYEMAENMYKDVLEITKKTLGEKHQEYATTSNNLALLYGTMGHYDQAEPLFKKALQIRKETLGENHIEYAESLNNLALLYQKMNRSKEAEPLFQKALSITKNSLGEKNTEYAVGLTNLAAFYEENNQDNKAKELFLQAKEIIKQELGESHPIYAAVIHDLAMVYRKQKDYGKAESIYKDEINIIKSSLGINNRAYVSGIIGLAGVYENTGKYTEAEKNYQEAMQITKGLFGEKHPQYAFAATNLARVSTVLKKYDEAEKYWNIAIDNYLYQIQTYFPSMSEKEKEQFYFHVHPVFEQFNSFALLRANTNPLIIGKMYNNQLATKAILLNASNKLRENILNSGDKALINDYRNWQAQKEFLSEVYSLTKEEIKNKNINVDSIELHVNDLEKQLSLRSELFKSTTEKQTYTWEEVQKKLKQGEAAIEIIAFTKFKSDSAGTYTDSVYYASLVVRPDTKNQPEIVLARNGADLENKFVKYYRNAIKFKVPDDHAYNQFWRRIKEKLNGVSKVYLSPDGIYNNINLYAIKNPETKGFIVDEIEIEIITNSKDLVIPQKTKTFDNRDVVLIGNPSFYLDNETTGNIAPLPGTGEEVKKINDKVVEVNWKGNMYVGNMAKEETVKEIKNPRVLHIATHGFFQPDVDIKDEKDDKKNENPLLKSGLMLAGSGIPSYLNDAAEDGILTAYEAMNLNLDQTDLVVLSACETGLGEIKNGQGVYGLQRAFRVAGAQTLIISLWKVDDVTTQKLMVAFYEAWLKTNNKREAFKLAQQKVRAEHADPYFWAAFVMIGE
ncbi:MAG: CHAT domain-containing protein [Cytophagaceae bacterium]|nr:CHAT domain-containing protein [Cytophagaceae bacterium]